MPDRLQILERRGPLLPLQVVSGRRAVPASARLRPYKHELVGVRIRRRREQRGVDDAEDGRVRPNAERQRQYGDQREAGIFYQGSRAEAQVLYERSHSDSSFAFDQFQRWLYSPRGQRPFGATQFAFKQTPVVTPQGARLGFRLR